MVELIMSCAYVVGTESYDASSVYYSWASFIAQGTSQQYRLNCTQIFARVE